MVWENPEKMPEGMETEITGYFLPKGKKIKFIVAFDEDGNQETLHLSGVKGTGVEKLPIPVNPGSGVLYRLEPSTLLIFTDDKGNRIMLWCGWRNGQYGWWKFEPDIAV